MCFLLVIHPTAVGDLGGSLQILFSGVRKEVTDTLQKGARAGCQRPQIPSCFVTPPANLPSMSSLCLLGHPSKV